MERQALQDPEAFNRMLAEEMPVGNFLGIRALEMKDGRSVLKLPFTPNALRPGDRYGGPSLFAVADLGMYAAVLSIYPADRMCLSISVDSRFLGNPGQNDIIAISRIVSDTPEKLFLTSELFADGQPDRPVFSSSGHYTPPRN